MQRTAVTTKPGIDVPDDVLLPDAGQVSIYLQEHLDLANVVSAVCARARHEFGHNAQLALEVYHDPEIVDPHLVLYVRLPAYDSSVMKRIDQVRDAFAQQLTSASGWLHVTTDFHVPQQFHGV